MPRLIDADALRREADTEDKNGLLTFSDVVTWIDEQPTVDAVPVRHGKWIHDGYDNPHGVDWMHCSECGSRDVYCPAAMTNYCPNCGARMEEDA